MKYVELEFPFTLSDRVFAEFMLILASKVKMLAYAIGPCVAVWFVWFVYSHDKSLSSSYWLLVLVLVLFGPLLTFIGMISNYYSNVAFRKPFKYVFDAEGIKIISESYEIVHKWSAITKIKHSKHYLFFYISHGVAHCIPLKYTKSLGKYEELLELVHEQTVEKASI